MNIGNTLTSMLEQSMSLLTPPTSRPLPVLQPRSVLPPRGMFLCLLGPAGVGKSSFCAQWPSPEFVIDPRDEGVIDLLYEGLLPDSVTMDQINQCVDYSEFVSNLWNAINGPSKTIILESLVGIQDLCLDHCCKQDFEGKMTKEKFLNYQDGPILTDSKYFKAIIDAMQVGQRRGKHMILCAHSKVADAKNVGGDDWLTSTIQCTKQFSKRIEATFMNIFQIVLIPSFGDRDRGASKKAKSDHTSWIYPHQNPQYFAKNRMGLVCEFEFPPSPQGAFLKFCEETKRNPKTGYRLV